MDVPKPTRNFGTTGKASPCVRFRRERYPGMRERSVFVAHGQRKHVRPIDRKAWSRQDYIAASPQNVISPHHPARSSFDEGQVPMGDAGGVRVAGTRVQSSRAAIYGTLMEPGWVFRPRVPLLWTRTRPSSFRLMQMRSPRSRRTLQVPPLPPPQRTAHLSYRERRSGSDTAA